MKFVETLSVCSVAYLALWLQRAAKARASTLSRQPGCGGRLKLTPLATRKGRGASETAHPGLGQAGPAARL